MWPFRRKQVRVDVNAIKTEREKSEQKLAEAKARLQYTEETTTRPLREMIRENHVSERLDYLITKARRNDPGPAHH